MLIYYYLSEKGRKLEFSAGRPAQEKRSIDIDVSDIVDLENIYVDESGSPQYNSFVIIYATNRREVKVATWGNRHFGKYDHVLSEVEAKEQFASWRERVMLNIISLDWEDAIKEDKERSKLAAEEAACVERLMSLYREGKLYEKNERGHWRVFK